MMQHFAGYAAGCTDQALFSLTNSDSNVVPSTVVVKRCSIRPVIMAPSFNPGLLSVALISSHGQGVNVPMVPSSTAGATLPAGAVRVFSDVSLSSSILHTRNSYPFPAAAPFSSGYALNSSYNTRVGASQLLRLFPSAAPGHEPPSLSEGRGLAIVVADTRNAPYPTGWRGTLHVRVGGTTSVWGSFESGPLLSGALLSVFREVGSPTIEILSIELEPLGPPTINSLNGPFVDAPLVRLWRGRALSGGELTPPTPYQTDFPAPTTCQLRVHRAWAPVSWVPDVGPGLSAIADLGYPSAAIPAVRRAGTLRQLLLSMTINPITLPDDEYRASQIRKGVEYNAVGDSSPVEVRAGESFAAVLTNSSFSHCYYFEIDYYVVPAPSTGGETATPFIG